MTTGQWVMTQTTFDRLWSAFASFSVSIVKVTSDLKPDDELDPNAEDGEPEAPDVRTDPVEDDPSATDEPVTEDN